MLILGDQFFMIVLIQTLNNWFPNGYLRGVLASAIYNYTVDPYVKKPY